MKKFPFEPSYSIISCNEIKLNDSAMLHHFGHSPHLHTTHLLAVYLRSRSWFNLIDLGLS